MADASWRVLWGVSAESEPLNYCITSRQIVVDSVMLYSRGENIVVVVVRFSKTLETLFAETLLLCSCARVREPDHLHGKKEEEEGEEKKHRESGYGFFTD